MMVVREQTPSEALAIVPIQFFVPASQQTTTDVDFEPTPMLQIEGARETTPEPPNNFKKQHPSFPQLQQKCKFIRLESIFAYHPYILILTLILIHNDAVIQTQRTLLPC
ncbi:hypothetical protein Ahy_A09g044706 isoform B [Arachis hypogaea]|uniref:Uncharacterized protein n=1 Tax=Arachis hypogaea TaxID=3818 RepID=A0A445BKK3_ARAHY|nr:hypothetical protein Ahy_A09g044706 isoform B [Arachis hypogaea]